MTQKKTQKHVILSEDFYSVIPSDASRGTTELDVAISKRTASKSVILSEAKDLKTNLL